MATNVTRASGDGLSTAVR